MRALSTADPRPPSRRPASAAPEAPCGHAIVLFDGVCNLCNSTVLFVIDRDPEDYFRFAALQSESAANLLSDAGLGGWELRSILLLEDGIWHSESTAALRIVRHLSGPWPLLYSLILLPRPIRDAVYRWVARSRYRWFGRTNACRVPSPELSARFLDGAVIGNSTGRMATDD